MRIMRIMGLSQGQKGGHEFHRGENMEIADELNDFKVHVDIGQIGRKTDKQTHRQVGCR